MSVDPRLPAVAKFSAGENGHPAKYDFRAGAMNGALEPGW